MLFKYGRDHEHEHETIFVGNFRHSSGYVCLSGDVQNCKCYCYSSSFATSAINFFNANSLKQHKFKSCTFWASVKVQRYHELYLFTSFHARKFKAMMKVSKWTFNFICSHVAPLTLIKYINMRSTIRLKTRVAIGILRLGT